MNDPDAHAALDLVEDAYSALEVLEALIVLSPEGQWVLEKAQESLSGAKVYLT